MQFPLPKYGPECKFVELIPPQDEEVHTDGCEILRVSTTNCIKKARSRSDIPIDPQENINLTRSDQATQSLLFPSRRDLAVLCVTG